MKGKDMAISLKLQTRVVMITLVLMIAAVAVRRNQGFHRLAG
jgi:hypothetical protein